MAKRIFLDTNICIDAANRTISDDDWTVPSAAIRRNYRYCISWITVKELFAKLSRGSPDYWQTNMQPLRYLASNWGSPGPQYLAYPPNDAISAALKVDIPDPAHEKSGRYLQTIVSLVLRSSSKAQLKRGMLKKGSVYKGERFDLADWDESENEPQRVHAMICDGLREGTYEFPADATAYAKLLLQDYGIADELGRSTVLGDRLDAAYSYSRFMVQLARNENYDFTKRQSNWGDTLQLFYLADQNTHFLTADQDFKARTSGSLEASRILYFDDFIAKHRAMKKPGHF